MEHAEAARGRVFVLRLHNGEVLHESIERFASEKKIKEATVIAVGGADSGSRLTVGPEDPDASPITPMYHVLEGQHEFTGTGTIFPNSDGAPILHMHCSCGRAGRSVTGCVRSGVIVWLVMEVVITEIVASGSKRLLDEASGFEILTTDPGR